jgi:hypothetical protein
MVAAEQAEAVIQSVRTNKEIFKDKKKKQIIKITDRNIIIPSHVQEKRCKEISQ